jgi:hypothetical protein
MVGINRWDAGQETHPLVPVDAEPINVFRAGAMQVGS